jgi:beta-glucosidase
VAYTDGYGEPCGDDPAAIQLAVQAAKGADAAVVFVGLQSTYEVEGRDRAHMRMPSQMNALVGAVAEANPRTIVVLLGGSSMELSTCDKAAAILWMGLAGQAIGGSIVDVLFGATSPTGRLAETWPMQLDDVPCQAKIGRAHV